MSALDGYWLNVVSGDWGKQVIMIADVLVVVAAGGGGLNGGMMGVKLLRMLIQSASMRV